MFKPYFNPKIGRHINATDFMYNAIYKAQGYIPVGESENVIHIRDENRADDAETATDIQGGSGGTNNGAVIGVGKRRNRKSA